MFAQVCLDCPNLGDVRALTDAEIRYFYNVLRGRLQLLTKPKK